MFDKKTRFLNGHTPQIPCRSYIKMGGFTEIIAILRPYGALGVVPPGYRLLPLC